MSETERIRVGALVSVLVLFVPGFLVHEAPRFPGSLLGGVLGIFGAVLMVLLLAYSLARRSVHLKELLAKHVSMRALLEGSWSIPASKSKRLWSASPLLGPRQIRASV